jgi:hypothetical protein
MKIAVLLRGQPRFSDYGAALFKKFIKERFPQHEFRIFIASWKSVSNVMASPIPVDSEVYGREYDQTLLNVDQIEDTLKKWKPGRFRIINESELFNLIRQIYRELISDQRKYTALQNILPKDIDPPENARNLLVPTDIDDLIRGFSHPDLLINNIMWNNKIEYSAPTYALKRNMINNHYLYGQIYSAGASYEVYRDHSLEQDWHADLIWSTRQDMLSWYPDNSFEGILRDLTDDCKKCDDSPTVFADRVEIHRGRPWVSDYNWYMQPSCAQKLLDNIQQRFHDWILNETKQLITIVGSGASLQHVMWSVFFNSANILQLNPFIMPTNSLPLRPLPNLDQLITQILEGPTEAEAVQSLANEINKTYFYPSSNAPVPDSVVDQWYDFLCEN